MEYSFNCNGHQNITAKHKTTLEFTKDKGVSLKGDCIVGVRADFDLDSLKKFMKSKVNNKKNQYYKNQLKNKKTINKIPIKIIMKINNYKEEINGLMNPDFDDGNEIVIRESDFVSKRTLVINADKGACELKKGIIKLLKNPENRVFITLR